MRVAINGFGRIGRAVLKIALDKNINVVAINDLQNPEQIEYLLKYDSVYGKYDKTKTNIKRKNNITQEKIIFSKFMNFV
jgi:glyceraldehyde 3-phosphate dehydrogenase